MYTLDFLERCKDPVEGLHALQEMYDLKITQYEDRVVLNYNQITSPKNNLITNECRALILSYPDFRVMSRSFDRFFNYGEVENQDLDINGKHIYEKLDGSLINIYWDFLEYKWQVATKGTAFGEAECYSGGTYKELVFEALRVREEKEFQELCDRLLTEGSTYICEITSPKNRIVTRYTDTKLYLLAVRDNATGEYINEDVPIFHSPRTFTFSNTQACLGAVSSLKTLEEGYVVYSAKGVPVYKIKSPFYVQVHQLRGNNQLTPKNCASLVIRNEVDEYLTYFPEDKPMLDPYINAWENMLSEIEDWMDTSSKVGDQKVFAMQVKDKPYSGVVFKMRSSGESVEKVLDNMRENGKIQVLLNYMGD